MKSMWGRFFLLIGLVLFFGWAQVPVHLNTKGPLHNAVWDSKNPYVQGNKFAQSLKSKNFNTSQFIWIEMDYEHPLTKKDLEDFSKRAKSLKEKTGWVTSSLSRYFRVGEEDFESYIPNEINGTFDISSWRNAIAQNPAVYGHFISKDFTTLSMVLLVPSEENEIPAVRRIIDILEGVEFKSSFESVEAFLHTLNHLFWKTDVFPLQEEGSPKIYVYSWAMGRFGINQGFSVDSRIKIAASFVFLLLPYLMVIFRFVYPCVFSVWVATFLPLLFATGSVWPLQTFGVYQTVYFLPPLALFLVVSFSFNIQKMEIFRTLKEGSFEEKWRKVNRATQPAINLITTITVVSFVVFGLWLQNLWRAVEIDVLFLLGTAWSWIVARYFLPSIYFFFSRFMKEEKGLKWWQKDTCYLIEKTNFHLVQTVTKVNLFILGRVYLKITIWALPLFFLGISSLLFYQGRVNTVSDPLRYLPPDSNIVKMLRHANRDGGPGLDVIQILFGMPSVPYATRTNEFFKEATEFEARLQKIPGIMRTWSVTKEVSFQIKSLQDLEEPKVANAFDLVQEGEDFMNRELASYIHNNEFVLILASHKMERDDELRVVLKEIEKLRSKFMNRNDRLYITIFGEAPFFPEMARILVSQFPQVVISSLALIFLAGFLVARKRGYGIRQCLRVGSVLPQPFIFATGVIGIGMVIFNIPLDMGNSPILQLTIAAAADFSIYPVLFFLSIAGLRNTTKDALEETLREKGKAVLIDCGGNMLCLGLLCMSSFATISYLGFMTQVSLAACVSWSLMTTLPLLVNSQR